MKLEKLKPEQIKNYNNFMINLYNCIIKKENAGSAGNAGNKNIEVIIDKNVNYLLKFILDELKENYKTDVYVVSDYLDIKVLKVSWGENV